MREAKEVEGFRLPLASFLAVGDGKTTELNESGFVLMQFQSELGHPFNQLDLEHPRIGQMLESHNEVIGITHNVDFATCLVVLPPVHP